MKKIMVTGASGMLGTYLIRELLKYGDVEIIATRHKNFTKFLDNERVMHIPMSIITDEYTGEKPDVIIHCAGLTDVDYCEKYPHLAMTTNTTGTANMQRLANKVGVRFIFISTNDVFGNCENQAGWQENDIPHPVNWYGKSKLEAERAVTNGIIIRTSFYGWSSKSLPCKVIDALSNGKGFQAAVDQHSNMMYAGDLAKELATIAIYNILTDKIIHIASRSSASRFVFAREVAHSFGLDENLVKPVPYSKIQSDLKLVATRPLRAILNTPFHYTIEDGIEHMVQDAEMQEFMRNA